MISDEEEQRLVEEQQRRAANGQQQDGQQQQQQQERRKQPCLMTVARQLLEGEVLSVMHHKKLSGFLDIIDTLSKEMMAMGPDDAVLKALELSHLPEVLLEERRKRRAKEARDMVAVRQEAAAGDDEDEGQGAGGDICRQDAHKAVPGVVAGTVAAGLDRARMPLNYSNEAVVCS